MDVYYAVDSETIISEKTEDEMLVINLENGCYYNLNASASVIFDLFCQANSQKSVCMKYTKIFSVNDEVAGLDVKIMIDYMLDKQFLITVESKVTACNESYEAMKYVKPVIDEYTDMQEMLLLDPIHEVKEIGWPHKKEQNDG